MLTCKRFEDLAFSYLVVEPGTPFSAWKTGIDAYGEAGLTKFELYDLRKMTIAPEDHEISWLAYEHEHAADLRPVGSKTAVLTTNSEHRWLVRYYDILSGVSKVNWQTRAFSELKDATHWLGIEFPETVLAEISR